MRKETFTYGTSEALTSNAFSKGTAYAFNGWNTKADGSGTSYTNGQSVKNLTSTSGGTVTLYAQWKLRYIYPTIGNITALRYEDNQEDDVGTCVHVEFPWSVDTVVPTEAGITNYASKIALKYRVHGNTQWTLLDEVNYTASTGSSSDTYSYTSPTGTVDIELTYDILVELTDYYGTRISISAPQATSTSFISKAFFTMDFATGGHGVGIGMPAPEEGLDVGLHTTFYNNSNVRIRKQYDNEAGVWVSSTMMDVPDGGDTYVSLGIGANSDNRGVYLGSRGTNSAYWMIREYWASGTPRIEIGNSAYTNGVYLMGHNSSIGYYTTGSGEASLANSTSIVSQWKKITTLAAGSWIIICGARFVPNAASGAHAFSINCGDSTHASSYVAGINGTSSTISESFSTVVSTKSSSLDVYINARQNSGAAVTVSYYWRIMRVA